MRKQMKFIRHFLRNPEKVGAITALNEAVAREITKFIEREAQGKSFNILEVGAGYGNISKFIVDLLEDSSLLDIIEVDKDCCTHLEKKFAKPPKVNIHCCSIYDWKPEYSYDFIISTIPFNSFSKEFVQDILNHYQALSNKNTILSYVEYAAIQTMRRPFLNKNNKRLITARKQLLDEFQKKYLIEKRCIMTNIPPCNVYHLKMN